MTYSRVSVFTFTCCAYRKLGWTTKRLKESKGIQVFSSHSSQCMHLSIKKLAVKYDETDGWYDLLLRSAHRTPTFTNPEFHFPQFNVLQSVFNIMSSDAGR